MSITTSKKPTTQGVTPSKAASADSFSFLPQLPSHKNADSRSLTDAHKTPQTAAPYTNQEIRPASSGASSEFAPPVPEQNSAWHSPRARRGSEDSETDKANRSAKKPRGIISGLAKSVKSLGKSFSASVAKFGSLTKSKRSKDSQSQEGSIKDTKANQDDLEPSRARSATSEERAIVANQNNIPAGLANWLEHAGAQIAQSKTTPAQTYETSPETSTKAEVITPAASQAGTEITEAYLTRIQDPGYLNYTAHANAKTGTWLNTIPSSSNEFAAKYDAAQNTQVKKIQTYLNPKSPHLSKLKTQHPALFENLNRYLTNQEIAPELEFLNNRIKDKFDLEASQFKIKIDHHIQNILDIIKPHVDHIQEYVGKNKPMQFLDAHNQKLKARFEAYGKYVEPSKDGLYVEGEEYRGNNIGTKNFNPTAQYFEVNEFNDDHEGIDNTAVEVDDINQTRDLVSNTMTHLKELTEIFNNENSVNIQVQDVDLELMFKALLEIPNVDTLRAESKNIEKEYTELKTHTDRRDKATAAALNTYSLACRQHQTLDKLLTKLETRHKKNKLSLTKAELKIANTLFRKMKALDELYNQIFASGTELADLNDYDFETRAKQIDEFAKEVGAIYTEISNHPKEDLALSDTFEHLKINP